MSRLRALTLAFALLILLPGRASAHAYLERSSPAANTVVESAPRRVQLWFTEQPELRFTEVTVYTADGDRLGHGPLSPAPDNPRSLTFDLDSEPNGTYTVAWKTLSAEDGHTAAGAFAYAVGLDQPPPTAASIFVPADQASDPSRPSAVAILGRTLAYAGAALAAGVPFFWLTILRPALLSGRRGQQAALGAPVASRLGALTWLGVGLALCGALFTLLGQALAVSSGDPAGMRRALVELLSTRGGLLLAARVVAVAALTAAAWQLRRRGWSGAESRLAGKVAVGAGVPLLLAQSLSSHAAATSIWTTFTVAVDWLHLAAMTIWIGGLVALAAAVPLALAERPEHERAGLLAPLVGRFSSLGLWCVGLLTLSGLYQSWVHVGQPDGLTRTSYGLALLLKLALVLPLVALGALNLLLNRPGLARAAALSTRQAGRQAATAARRLKLAVRLEVLLGAAILLTTGVLTNLPPAREALVQLGRAQSRTVQLGALRPTLTVDPAVAGLNTYDVALVDGSGRPYNDADRVALRFRHTQHDMGEIELVLPPRGEGHYTAQGSYLSMAGPWDVEVRVRPPGEPDLAGAVDILAADPSAGDLSRAAEAPSLGTSFVFGLELLAGAVLVLVFRRRLRPPLRRPLNTLVPRLGAVALGVAGLYYLWSGLINDLTPTAALANPIPPTRASLERGHEVYVENCLSCHGEQGRGDGPAGRVLRPRPADLRQHTTQHTEGQLYWWISKGFPGTAMPAWEDRLSEEDRWNVLNYIVQTFRPDTESSARAPGP